MSHHGPLRNEFLKYQKRKQISIDGSISGAEYSQFHRPTTPPLGSSAVRGRSHEHKMYMGDFPKEYRPNINAPSVNWDEYESYEPFARPNSLISDNSRLVHSFNGSNNIRKLPEIIQQTEQDADFDMQADIARPAPKDIVRRFLDLTDALNCLQETLPKEHPDIVNLTHAIRDIINDPQAMSQIETLAGDALPSKLGTGNPYEVDMFLQVAKEYGRQAELFEESIKQLSMDYQIAPEIMPDISASEPIAKILTLEDIVANHDIRENAESLFMGSDIMAMPGPEVDMVQVNEMAAEEINNAINQAIEQPLQQEPELMQEDPFLIAQQMFEQQMQYMANPFMMPGPM